MQRDFDDRSRFRNLVQTRLNANGAQIFPDFEQVAAETAPLIFREYLLPQALCQRLCRYFEPQLAEFRQTFGSLDFLLMLSRHIRNFSGHIAISR
jgi:hypothetical protein